MFLRYRLISVLVFVVAVGGCAESSTDVDPTELSTTTTSAAQPVVQAGGPCVDENHEYLWPSGVGVQVSSGGQTVRASFGSDFVGFCPGHPEHGISRDTHSDGFFADLESTLLQVEPGAELTLTAPGYPGATLGVNWSIDSVSGTSFPATTTPAGEATWSLSAPTEPDEYVLYIGLDWFEGEASYAVRVATRELPPEGEELVPIEPSGNVAMHPTVVPYGYADCGTTGEVVRLCDPEREHLDHKWYCPL